MVVRIPAGATSIDVRQHSFSGRPEDDNYLGEMGAPAICRNSGFLEQVADTNYFLSPVAHGEHSGVM